VSTQRYSRVLWVVLDGMGFEHVRLALGHGRHPALSRIDREGIFLPMRPASPVCQTPPALLALFTGTQPVENGVWGYSMPHPDRLESAVSGFFSDVGNTRPIWRELEERGAGYSLMNVAFRSDPVWREPSENLAFGYDGFRLWRKPSLYRLSGGTDEISLNGIRLRARWSKGLVRLTKGASLRVELAAGEGRIVDLTRGRKVFVHLLEPKTLLLNPVNDVVCRGSNRESAEGGNRCDGFLEMSTFRLARRLNGSRPERPPLSVEAEIFANRVSFRRSADLMVSEADDRAARLVVGYFPAIDDFNHAYFDLLEGSAHSGEQADRTSALFHGCMDMVDGLLGRLMQGMEGDTLLVVSSDHGAMAFRSMLHLNEILADAGLVRRRPGGYDYGRSLAWYHPSDCGQVVTRETSRRAALLRRVKLVLDAANAHLGADIGVLDEATGSPFLAFLYPKGDTYFTGRPPRRNGPALDKKRNGGQHLSPLSPTPWIQSALGLWSPRGGGVGDHLPFTPRENIEMKRFLMEMLGLS
jgi:Type I phosphodiesterase / nucleotide pyrophosphatase